jgi:hypothetical protein
METDSATARLFRGGDELQKAAWHVVVLFVSKSAAPTVKLCQFKMVIAAEGRCAQSALCLFINKSSPMGRTLISGHAVRSRRDNIGILVQAKNAATEASYPESFAVEKMGCSDAYLLGVPPTRLIGSSRRVLRQLLLEEK